MITAAHHKMLGHKNTPYAKQVAYVSSDGTSCVETNCIPTNNTKYRIIYNVYAMNGTEANVIGLYDNISGTANRVYIGPYPNGGALRTMLIATENNITGLPTFGENIDLEYICDISNSLITVNYSGGTKIQTIGNIGTFVTQKSVGLFARNNYNTTDGHKAEMFAVGKIYVFEAWENGVQTAKYVPVVDLNGVACFYDEIENVLHYPWIGNPLTAGPNI